MGEGCQKVQTSSFETHHARVIYSMVTIHIPYILTEYLNTLILKENIFSKIKQNTK